MSVAASAAASVAASTPTSTPTLRPPVAMVSASPTTVTAARTHDARSGLVTQDTIDWMPEAL